LTFCTNAVIIHECNYCTHVQLTPEREKGL
jgi:hypothetical protein